MRVKEKQNMFLKVSCQRQIAFAVAVAAVVAAVADSAVVVAVAVLTAASVLYLPRKER